jgi:hypothetical protein
LTSGAGGDAKGSTQTDPSRESSARGAVAFGADSCFCGLVLVLAPVHCRIDDSQRRDLRSIAETGLPLKIDPHEEVPAMRSTTKRGKLLLTAFVAVMASGFGSNRAQAQWGGGGGWGFGFGGAVEQPGTFLNSVALAQMGHVRGPTQNNVYAGNPNSYINHVRDNGFVDQYSPYRRQPNYYGYGAPSPSPARTMTQTAMNPAPAKPLVPLSSFFNAQNQLVWPGDAPMADALKEKRTVFDQAAQAVLGEVKKSGVASIATVTDTRQKLLDYGRPALKYVRIHETPRVADSFHGFLLMLYDSLAQAADPPTATAAAGSPSPPSS